MSEKQKKIFKRIIIVLAIIFVVELFYFGIRIYINRKNSVFYTVVNSAIVQDEKNYVAVGLSDYRYSSINKFDKGYNKPTIFVVKKGEITKEIGLKLGYNGNYNDIIETSDGYIVVGKIEMTKEQHDEGISEAVIVKYDKKFKLVWRKNFNVIGTSEFYKVKLDRDNNILVVGTSVYGQGYVGNHSTGGGILLKYDQSGKELMRVNNGGPYSGKFNDIIIEKDGYVVAGLGKKNSGILIKYTLNGKKVWTSSYGYTDDDGINAIIKKGNHYIAATTKVVNVKDLSNYSASVVLFDKNGKLIDDVKYSDSSITYFSDLVVDKDGNVFASGYTGNKKDSKLSVDAIIVKFDKDLYEDSKVKISGEKDDYFNNIYLSNNYLFALGYTNSKIKEFSSNGYDYYPIVKKYNTNLK